MGPDRPNKRDNHANTVFAYEGEELRDRLSKLDGVIVLCGDRHWQYASVDAESGLWEFGCGPGSEKHQLGWKAGDRREPRHYPRRQETPRLHKAPERCPMMLYEGRDAGAAGLRIRRTL